MTVEQLNDAWRVNNAVNLELLEMCEDEHFEFKPGKGKTIRSNWTHIVSVRGHWLKERMQKESAHLKKLDWKTATRKDILSALDVTNDLMQQLFQKMEESDRAGRFDTTVKFFAYCIAHEAHHRSQIEIALRINGHEPEDILLYGLWDWPKK
ncbi:MAG: DinB family protein [Armatimonadetes bacterium]|nr:DinB family protein [Armatimonadota bacterium]